MKGGRRSYRQIDGGTQIEEATSRCERLNNMNG